MTWVRAALALALLLVGGLPAAGAADPPRVEWWGPTAIQQGFHLRIPVTVTNGYGFPVTNAPAMAQLDVAAALKQSGWASVARGDRDILQSFTLDLDSVRVAAMENLDPPSPAIPRSGRLRVVDSSFDDQRRYEVPSLALPGFLDLPQAEPFNPQTNPLMTVVWEVAGTLAPGDKRYFMVYFDTLGNADHPPAQYDNVGWGHLQSLFWSGPGLELVGVARPQPTTLGSVGILNVAGLHDGTTVHVYRNAGGSQWAPMPPQPGFPSSPFIINKDEVKRVFAGTNIAAPVRLVADKPILGYGVGTGFVPSLDGGMAGRSFLFAKTLGGEDDTIHFIATSDEPTVVEVDTVPPSGAPLVFGMNAGRNGYSYTVGDRSGEFGPVGEGCPPPEGDPPTLLPSMGLYQAKVVSGGPVLLQHAPNANGFQVPARNGASTGSDLMAATGWTDENRVASMRGPSCVGGPRFVPWFAAGLDGPVTMTVTSLESAVQLDPPGTGANPFPPPRNVPGSPELSGPNNALLADRPVQFRAEGGDVALYAGRPLAGTTSAPAVHGPWGGADAGRRFAGHGPTVLYAPYPNTVVTATFEGVAQAQELNLAAGQVMELEAPTGGVRGFRLESTRPLIAYPLLVDPATLAALPMFLSAQAGPAEFRGHMVDLRSPSGLDPVTGSTVLGEPISYALELTNLGRDALGAGLGDTIDLEVTPAHDGWTAELEDNWQSIQMSGGDTVRIGLVVTPGPDVAPGSLGVFQVTATSRGNPGMSDTVSTVTYLKRSYEVGLYFTAVGNPQKLLTRSIEAGTTTEYALILKNEGSVEDIVSIKTTSPAEGWQVSLLQGGQPFAPLLMEPGEAVPLTLRVSPPPGVGDGVLITTVTATASGGARDHLTATTKLRAPSDLHMEVAREHLLTAPGGEALFSVTLRNEGVGGATVELSAVADRLRGWTSLGTFVLAPVRVNLTGITLLPGESFTFLAGVRVPATAAAGQALGLQVVAQASDGRDRAEAFMRAAVGPLHRLEATLPPLPLASATGFEGAPIAVRLTNLGNLDERLAVRVGDLPAEWKLGAPAELAVLRNATATFALNLTVPDAQAPGLYNVTLDLVSRDGNVTSLRLPVSIGALALGGTGDARQAIAVQPGLPARLAVPVRNEGNVLLEVRVLPVPSEPWRLSPGAISLRLPPGANASVQLSWDVPTTAANGVSWHAARVALVGPDGQQTVRDVEAAFEVGRADLSPVGFRAYPGPAGTLLEGRVANLGTRPAPPFVVRLLAGQETLEDLAVEGIGPGGNATVRLLLPHGNPGTPSVVVDATGAVVEADEANNAVSLDPASLASPASGLLGLLVVLAAALARTPRVRRR